MKNPTMPDEDDYLLKYGKNGFTHRKFETDKKFVKEVEFFDKEIIMVYRTSFPNFFTSLDVGEKGIKSGAKGQEYHDNILKECTKNMKKKTDIGMLMTQLVGLRYVPDATGGSTFFHHFLKI